MPDADVRETTAAPLPRPRPAGDDTVVRPASSPWPEPWHVSAAGRPRTAYWDVETAGWRSRGPAAGDPTTG